jgi:glycoside/pentoside/hexuronide:cation symporter, GPH family
MSVPHPRRIRDRLVFAAPEIAINLMFASINAWYLFYLVQIVGLVPLLAGIAFFIGRVMDGLFDPLVGHWSDRWARSRRRKTIIALAIGPTLCAFVLIWALPAMATGTLDKFLLATIGFSAFTFGYTLVTLPRLAMLPAFEPDYDGRTTQVSYDLVLAFLAIGAAMAGLPALIGVLAGGGLLSGASVAAWVQSLGALTVLAGLAYLPFLAFFTEPPRVVRQQAPVTPLAVFLRSLWRSDLGGLAVIFFLSVVSIVLVQSMLPFFLEVRIGIAAAGHAVLLGLVFGMSILSFPLWSLLSRRIGKRRGLMLGVAVYALFLMLVPFIPARVGITPLLLLACALAGAGVSALSLFPWSMIPDMVERHCAINGPGQEGLCTATFTMTNKLAIGTAVLMNAAILSLAGGRETMAEAGPEVQRIVTLAIGPVPLLVCLGLLWLLRRTRTLDRPPA